VTDSVQETPATTPAPSASLISTTLLLYALFGVAAVIALFSHGFPLVAPLMGLVGIIALIIAYVKRADAAGTWLASHYRWLIRTFWFSLLWGVIGGLILITLGLILIGIPIAFARISAVQRQQAGAGNVTHLSKSGYECARDWKQMRHPGRA